MAIYRDKQGTWLICNGCKKKVLWLDHWRVGNYRLLNIGKSRNGQV